MKKLILLLLLPIAAQANHKSVFDYCNSLDVGHKEVCLLNANHVWKGLTKKDVSYCLDLKSLGQSACFNVAGCSEFELQPLLNCVSSGGVNAFNLCNSETISIIEGATETCSQRLSEFMN